METPEINVVEPDGNQLLNYILRLEHLAEEKAEIANLIKEVFVAAKSYGYDTKIIREMLSRRAEEKAELEEKDLLLALYERAVNRVEG